MLLANLARVLRDLDELPEAERLTARASHHARRLGQEAAYNQSLLLRASIHRAAAHRHLAPTLGDRHRFTAEAAAGSGGGAPAVAAASSRGDGRRSRP